MDAKVVKNMVYDCLGKLEIVEMVMKSQDMDLSTIQKLKTELQAKLKESTK